MIHRHLSPTLGIVVAATLAACQPSDAHVVQVTAADFTFVAPSEIPSGWITFLMRNEGHEHHFFLLSRLPDGKTFEDYQEEITLPFDTVWHALKSGAVDKAEAGQNVGRPPPRVVRVRPADGGSGSRGTRPVRPDDRESGTRHLRHGVLHQDGRRDLP